MVASILKKSSKRPSHGESDPELDKIVSSASFGYLEDSVTSLMTFGSTRSVEQPLEESIRFLLAIDDSDDDSFYDDDSFNDNDDDDCSFDDRDNCQYHDSQLDDVSMGVISPTFHRRNDDKTSCSTLTQGLLALAAEHPVHMQVLRTHWEQMKQTNCQKDGHDNQENKRDDRREQNKDASTATTRKTTIGFKLLQSMIALDPSSAVSMGLSGTTESSHRRYDMMASLVVESLDHVILSAKPELLPFRMAVLNEWSMEWAEEGIDAKLLYRALWVEYQHLQHHHAQQQGKEIQFSFGNSTEDEAWRITLRDILYKMAF